MSEATELRESLADSKPTISWSGNGAMTARVTIRAVHASGPFICVDGKADASQRVALLNLVEALARRYQVQWEQLEDGKRNIRGYQERLEDGKDLRDQIVALKAAEEERVKQVRQLEDILRVTRGEREGCLEERDSMQRELEDSNELINFFKQDCAKAIAARDEALDKCDRLAAQLAEAHERLERLDTDESEAPLDVTDERDRLLEQKETVRDGLRDLAAHAARLLNDLKGE
jgi:chromosome segregation ATPase